MMTRSPSRDGAALAGGERGEQLGMLRESALRFCAPEVHVPRSRGLRGTSPGFDKAIWRNMAGLGWFGMLVPEQYGGAGLGLTELAAVCEAAGRALLPEPLVAGVVLGAGAILHGDNETLKRALLPKVLDGTLLPALAWREDGHDGDILAVTTEARSGRGAVRLSGVKRLVIGGAGADIFRYAAPTDGGDRIVDFSRLSDTLEFSALGFGDGLIAGMDLVAGGRFVSGVAANQAQGQFVYNRTTGALAWDGDGTGTGASQLIATLTGRPALTGGELHVIA